MKSFVAIEDEVQRFLADMGLKIVVMILFSKHRCTASTAVVCLCVHVLG